MFKKKNLRKIFTLFFVIVFLSQNLVEAVEYKNFK